MKYTPINRNIEQLDFNDKPVTGRAKACVTIYADLLSIRVAVARKAYVMMFSDPHGVGCVHIVDILKAINEAIDRLFSEPEMDLPVMTFPIHPITGDFGKIRDAARALAEHMKGFMGASIFANALPLFDELVEELVEE